LETIPIWRYKTDKEGCKKFQVNVHKIMKIVFQIEHNDNRDEDLDETLCSLLNTQKWKNLLTTSVRL
jgi:hypothetical protein